MAACSCWLSEDISELLSDWAVITLTMTLASPNRTMSPMMSLPLMVRSDSTAASRSPAAWPVRIRAGHQPAGFRT